jgi:hypothetical protein
MANRENGMKAEVGPDRDTTMIDGSRRGGDGCGAFKSRRG